MSDQLVTLRAPDDEAAFDLATETLYRYLAAALGDPRTGAGALVFDPPSQQLACAAADLLREEFGAQAIALGFGEAPAEDLDLRPLVRTIEAEPDLPRKEYVRVFGLGACRECPPYETEYQPNEDTFFRSQQMADIAGFYRAFGIEPGTTSRERPDHLALELEFQAFLLLKKRTALAADVDTTAGRESADICQQARLAFFRDHMSWWMPSFALALRHKAEQGFFEAAGRTLAALLPIERHRLGVAAPRMPLQPGPEAVPEDCAGCLASTT